jgi:hypothetical protein
MRLLRLSIVRNILCNLMSLGNGEREVRDDAEALGRASKSERGHNRKMRTRKSAIDPSRNLHDA